MGATFLLLAGSIRVMARHTQKRSRLAKPGAFRLCEGFFETRDLGFRHAGDAADLIARTCFISIASRSVLYETPISSAAAGTL